MFDSASRLSSERPCVTTTTLLSHYEAIERASREMLVAARAGHWDRVVELEGVSAVFIAQLKRCASEKRLQPHEAQLKSRLMQRILLNDAEIRQLAEPWFDGLDRRVAGLPNTVH